MAEIIGTGGRFRAESVAEFSGIRKERTIKQFIDASDNLRNAFNPTLANLAYARDYNSTHEAPDIDMQLFSALPSQTEAIIQFRWCVPKNKRAEYDKIWNEYRHWADKDNGVYVAQFIGEKKPYDFIANKIHAILQYTEKTN